MIKVAGRHIYAQHALMNGSAGMTGLDEIIADFEDRTIRV
jgi:hypothetical protein